LRQDSTSHNYKVTWPTWRADSLGKGTASGRAVSHLAPMAARLKPCPDTNRVAGLEAVLSYKTAAHYPRLMPFFFSRRSGAWRRLFLLQLLLLLRVPLHHLLCLLLVPLLDLLPSAVICMLSCELLVLFFLLLLKFLALSVLLRIQLFLLLLVFSVLLRVPRVWRSGTLGTRNLVRMHRASAPRGVVLRAGALSAGIVSACIPSTHILSTRIMNRASLAGAYDSALIKCSRSGSGSDGRLATVYGSP